MRKMTFAAIALPLALLAPPALADTCAGWLTPDPTFFETATLAVVQTCLDGGADPNARDEDGIAPLHTGAAGTKAPAVIDALTAAGADPSAQTNDGKLPWDFAKDNDALKGSAAYWALNDARLK